MVERTGPNTKGRVSEGRKRARRALILERLGSGSSIVEIAAKERLTPRRIRQIVSEARGDRALDDAALAMLDARAFPDFLRYARGLIADGDPVACRFMAKLVDRLDRLVPAADAPAG